MNRILILAFLGSSFVLARSAGVGLSNGDSGGALLTLRNHSATAAYNYNFPGTAGTARQIETSGGGGNAPNTWTSTTGSGKVMLAQSPALTDSPSATILQLSTIYTVSTLPACNSTALATESAVSDASTPSYLGALTGGSSTFTPVVCNGVGVLLA